MSKYELHDAPPTPTTHDRVRTYFPEDLLDELRENPGAWAVGGSANNTAQANYWRKRLPDFKIVTRKQEDGMHDYWIAYVGEENA